MSNKIPISYYQKEDVVSLAKDLLGKILFTDIGHKIVGGLITETEAYAGITDRASHAYGGRRTRRTEVMYREGGISYVYLCYGVHHLFNIVASGKDIPHAVLIRGVYPVEGWATAMERRKMTQRSKNISDGPGKLTKALGISLDNNGTSLDGNLIWLEDKGLEIREKDITIGKRIGVDYAAADAFLPYRFHLNFGKYIDLV
jgi:DNA-3-methyladenine glycosylase